ncbi:MAG: hypothetical protein IID51_13670 [Proteobacteria bacterium]|nr:hypothetical protein [Pseudomonadota bacterium]
MSISINGLNIADARIQGVSLLPVLGAYELVFGLSVMTYAEKKDFPCRASIVGARVSVKATGGKTLACGFARPNGPFEIRQVSHQSELSHALILPIQPGQLSAIENLRDKGDLDFELSVTGTGIDQYGEQQIHDTWRIPVPRSDWIKKLRDSRARDILLLEVPLPLGTKSKKWVNITGGLQSAEEQFRNGDYRSCVASCRSVVQDLGHQKFGKKAWAGPVLDRLASERNGLTKGEREAALWGVLRHYTHQAHHAGSEGGVNTYSRAEAWLVLTLAASFVARIMGE